MTRKKLHFRALLGISWLAREKPARLRVSNSLINNIKIFSYIKQSLKQKSTTVKN